MIYPLGIVFNDLKIYNMDMEALTALMGTAAIIIFLDSLGRVILTPYKESGFIIRIAIASIGVCLILTLLGFMHLLNEKLIVTLFLISYSALFQISKKNITFHLNKIQILKIRDIKTQTDIFLLTLIVYATIIALNTLTPPISRDAINYHLYLPKIYLEHNAILTIPNNIYSFFPSYWEVFNSFLISVSNDISAKLFHFFFLLLTLFLIADFIKLLKPDAKKIDIKAALLIFISTPLINKIASWAYIDFVFTFYCLLSLYLLIKYSIKKEPFFYYLSVVSMGFVLGTKYLGWLWLIALFSLFVKEDEKLSQSFIKYSKFAILAFVIASPFYIRNYIQTNNPFFPFFFSFFPTKNLDPEKYSLLVLYFKSYGQGIGIKELALLPYRLLFKSEFTQPLNFDGKINLLYLVGFIPFLKREKNSFFCKMLFLIIAVYFLVWFFSSQQLRFLIPVIAIIVIIFGLGFGKLKKHYLHYIVLIFSFGYLFYPIKDSLKTKPWLFISGGEKRSDFLTRNLSYYPIVEKINENIPHKKKIMLLDAGPMAYYFKTDIFQESIFEDYTFKIKLKESLESTCAYLKENNVDFVLVNELFLKMHFIPYLSVLEKERFSLFREYNLMPVYRLNELCLYRFISVEETVPK